jgi:hypothetical protein
LQAEVVENNRLRDELAKHDIETAVERVAQGRFGILGGRPPTQLELKSGVAGGHGSNRIQPGAARKRRDLGAVTKLSIAEALKADRPSFASAHVFWKVQVKKYSLPKKTLEGIEDKIEVWREFTARHKLGTGRYGPGKQARGMRRSYLKRQTQSNGSRDLGGGRQNIFSSEVQALKRWVETERSYGHTLSKRDLLDEFKSILEKTLSLNAASKRKLEAASVRLKKLNEGGKYAENYIEKLLRWTGTEFRKPHLVTGLSALQEQVGAQLTWQSFDRAQWVAACSPLEVLGQAVANPEQFRENLQHIIIGASDQVPFWVKTESSKALFAAFETAAVKQEEIRAARKRKLSSGSKGSSLSLEGEDAGAGESTVAEQTAPGEVVVKRPRPDVGGQAQLRKQGDAQFDRFRITYEARQVIQGPP